MFINDISDGLVGLGRLVADDTSIGHSASNNHDLINLINTVNTILKDGLQNWAVKFNPTKN